MKRLMLDHLQRWWWMWLLAGIAQAGWSAGDKAQSGRIFFVTMFLGAYLVQFDLQRRPVQALLALPVTARQLARAWWLVSVGLPALFLGGITGLVMLAVSACGAGAFPVGGFLEAGLSLTLWLGTMFFALTGLTSRTEKGFADQARAIFFGALWGLPIFGAAWMGKLEPGKTTELGVLLLTAAMTVAGWFRAEHLVRQRAGVRGVSPGPRTSRTEYKIQQGFGGLPFLVAGTFTRCLLIGLLMMGVMMIVYLATGHSQGTDGFIGGSQKGGYSVSFGLPFVVILIVFQFAPTIMHLRFLRTLPLPVSLLAATLVFVPVAAILSVGGILAVVAGPGADGASVLATFLMVASVGSLSMPVLAWRGLDTQGVIVSVFIVMGCSALLVGAFGQNVPGWFQLAGPAGLIALAFEITRRVLLDGSQAYRPRPNSFRA